MEQRHVSKPANKDINLNSRAKFNLCNKKKKAKFSDHSIDGFIHCNFVDSSIVSINLEVWPVELQDFFRIFRFPIMNVDFL
jgi:hypothetical protein